MTLHPDAIRRAVVVGTSGSGKSTFARQLAEKLGCPHIELDSVYWQDNWQPREDTDLFAALSEATSGQFWVLDGNYTRTRGVTWAKADTIIWLDYPRALVMWRILRRTFGRVLSGKRLWNTNNVETWRIAFFSKDSVIWWAWTTYTRNRRQYLDLIAQPPPEYAHLRFVRLQSPREAAAWLERL